jgi:hypothetical protein
MRHVATLVVATLLFILLGTSAAEGQVSIEINLPAFPELVIVPGYPVYYAPSVRANYFFDDGLYWVFNVDDGYWYSSSWYNGPWVYVEPAYVPQSILVVPYRYYRVRPEYWSGWQDDLPPRWGHQWGDRWESSRRGWDHWDRSRTYVAAPLPLYQKRYDRDHYPAPSQQVIIHNEQYHYQPQDVHVRRRHATILQEQSKGGAKARGKAEGLEKTQHRDKAQQQEKGQPQQRDKVQQQDKAQHRDRAPQQEKGQSQQRNKGQQQDKAQHRDKAQQQENEQSQQGHEGTKRQKKKGQDQEKGQEEAP